MVSRDGGFGSLLSVAHGQDEQHYDTGYHHDESGVHGVAYLSVDVLCGCDEE